MPVNKFGEYLESGGIGGGSGKKKDYSPIGSSSKSDKKLINCQNKRLTCLSRGIAKDDAINKAQFEESIIQCLTKIKTNSKNITELRIKIEKLIERITTTTTTATTGGGGKKTPKRITPIKTPTTGAAAAAVVKVKKS